MWNVSHRPMQFFPALAFVLLMIESAEAQFSGGRVLTACLSPDGSLAVTGTGEKRIHELVLWDVETMQELRVFPQQASVRQVVFSPNGIHVAAACFDQTVKLLDTTTGRIVAVLRGHPDGVNGVSYSADGSRLASISLDGTVKVWQAADWKELRTWKVGSHRPYTVGLSPDGSRLLSAGRGNAIEIWDVEQKVVLRRLTGHTEAVESAAYSPDGTRIVSAGWDRTIRLWDAETGSQQHVLKGHDEKIQRVTFSPDGSRLLTASADKSARLWRVDDPRIVEMIRAHHQRLYDVNFAADGKRFITASFDTTASVWETDSKQEIAKLNRRPLATTLTRVATLPAHHGGTSFVAFTPDGVTMATGGNDNVIRIWDMNDGALRYTLDRHDENVTTGSISRDGKYLATSGRDGVIHLWDLESGKWIRRIGDQDQLMTQLRFLSGDRLVAANRDGTVRITNFQSDEFVVEFEASVRPIRRLAVSPDESLIVTCSGEASELRLWNADSGESVGGIPNFTNAEIVDLEFSHDGSVLAMVGTDHFLTLWDVDQRRERATLRHPSSAIAFTRHGFELTSAGLDGRLAMFDARTLKRWQSAGNPIAQVTEVRLLPDRVTLATVTKDGRVILWAPADRPDLTASRVKEMWSNFRLPLTDN